MTLEYEGRKKRRRVLPWGMIKRIGVAIGVMAVVGLLGLAADADRMRRTSLKTAIFEGITIGGADGGRMYDLVLARNHYGRACVMVVTFQAPGRMGVEMYGANRSFGLSGHSESVERVRGTLSTYEVQWNPALAMGAETGLVIDGAHHAIGDTLQVFYLSDKECVRRLSFSAEEAAAMVKETETWTKHPDLKAFFTKWIEPRVHHEGN